MTAEPIDQQVTARQAVEQYTPDEIDPGVLQVVGPVAVATLLPIVKDDDAVKTARAWAGLMIDLLAWRYAFGDEISDPVRFLTPFVVESYLAQRQIHGGLRDHSVSTYRSHFHRMARLLGVGGWEKDWSERVRQSPPKPYSEKDLSRLLLAARSVPSRVVGPRAHAVTLVCLAAGLSTPDLRSVGPTSITRDKRDGSVLVRVEGSDPRTVVALDRYADELLDACTRIDTLLLAGNNPAKPSLVQPITEAMKKVDGSGFSVQRLRSTWIVGHLERGVPLGNLTVAAGLRSPEALLRYAAFARATPELSRARFRGQER